MRSTARILKADPGMTVNTAIAPSTFEVQPPLGQILLKRGAIGEADVAKALTFQSNFGGLLGAILVRIGAVSEDAVLDALSSQLGLEIMSNERLPQDPALYVAAMMFAASAALYLLLNYLSRGVRQPAIR